jgi:hypothetical protein
MADKPPTGPADPQLGSQQDPQKTQAEPAKPSQLETTINRLVGVTNQASEDVKQQRAENNELRSAMAALADQVGKLTAAQAPAPAGTPPQDTLPGAGTAQAPPGPGAPLNADAVRGMIREALGEQVQLTNEQAELLETQRTCYQECLQELPDLADARSPEGAAFNRIYQGRPDLQNMPDGPRIAMMLARDTVSQSRTEGRELADRKDRARVLQNASPRAEVTEESLRKLTERHAELIAHGKRAPFSDDQLSEYLDLKLALSNLPKGAE